jgi:hypothetical protein
LSELARISHTFQSRQGLRHAVGKARRHLTSSSSGALESARGVFFLALTRGALKGVLVSGRGDLAAADSELSEMIEELASCAGMHPVTDERQLLTEGDWFATPEWQAAITKSPTLLGWAYQFWNEEGRDAATWAISTRDENGLAQHEISLATQLYTEEYMTEFLVSRALCASTAKQEELSFIDPACGCGHFLVQAVRSLRSVLDMSPCEMIFKGDIAGIDIDPFAVVLARISVWIEVMREGVPLRDGLQVMEALSSSLVVLEAPKGTLDRSSTCAQLRRRYSCVATNPPFVGRRKLSKEMREFLDVHYPNASADLCTAFILRALELLQPRGALALVTVDKWLRLKCYRDLRSGSGDFGGIYGATELEYLVELGDRSFGSDVQLHDGVGIALLVTRFCNPRENHFFKYLDLSSYRSLSEKSCVLLSLDQNQIPGEGVTAVNQQLLRDSSDGSVLAEAAGIPALLARSPSKVENRADVVVGLQTNDDNRFVQYQWCVPPDAPGWVVHSKGGGYGRWYGINRFVLNLEGGREFFSGSKNGAPPACEKWFAHPGWTYTWFANGNLGLRRKEAGWSFGRAAASGVFTDDIRLIAYLNSTLASFLVRKLGGKVQLPEGVVRRVPVPECLDVLSAELVSGAITIKQRLVEQDPREVTFAPRNLLDPLMALRFEVALLMIEASIEKRVIEAAQLDSGTVLLVRSAVGAPVGLYTLRAGNDECQGFLMQLEAPVQELLSPLFAEFESEAIATSNEKRGARGISIDDVKDALLRVSSLAKSKPAAINEPPATSRMEQWSRELRSHPLDVYLQVERLVLSSLAVRRVVAQPFVAARILVEALRPFNHVWRSDCRRSEVTDGVITNASLAERVSQGVVDLFEANKLLMPYLEVLPKIDAKWVSSKFLREHSKDFLGHPLLLSGSADDKAAAVVIHRWSNGSGFSHAE